MSIGRFLPAALVLVALLSTSAQAAGTLTLTIGKVALAPVSDAYPAELREAALKNVGPAPVTVSGLVVRRLQAAGMSLQIVTAKFNPPLVVPPKKAVKLPILRGAVLEAKEPGKKEQTAGVVLAETESGLEEVGIDPTTRYEAKALSGWQQAQKAPADLGVPAREDALRTLGPLLLFAEKREAKARSAMMLYREPSSGTVFAPPEFCGGRTFGFRGAVSGGEFKLDPSSLTMPVCPAGPDLFLWVQGTPGEGEPAIAGAGTEPLNRVAVFRFFPSADMTKASVDVVYAQASLSGKGIVFAPPLDRFSLGSPILTAKGTIGVVTGTETGKPISGGDTLRTKPPETPLHILRIVSEPDLARIFIKNAKGVWEQQFDAAGRPLLTPATMRLPAGEYYVELRKPGYAPRTRPAPIKLDRSLQWDAPAMEPAKLEPPKPSASRPSTAAAPKAEARDFRLTTRPPGASVLVDQTQLPSPTPVRIPLATFPVLIRVKAPGDLFCSITLTEAPRFNMEIDLHTCKTTLTAPVR